MEPGDRYFWGLGLEIFFTGVLKGTASNVWLFLLYPSPLLPFSSPRCECCGKAGSRHSYLMNTLCNLVLSFLYRDFLSLQSGCVPSETRSSHSSPSAIPLNQHRWPKQNQEKGLLLLESLFSTSNNKTPKDKGLPTFLRQRREEHWQQREEDTKKFLSKLSCHITLNEFVQLIKSRNIHEKNMSEIALPKKDTST